MKRVSVIILPLILLLAVACSKSDLSDYSLGTETYPDKPECKQALYQGKPIPGVFLVKLIKAEGGRLEGIACHGKNIVVDVKTGGWKEGHL